MPESGVSDHDTGSRIRHPLEDPRSTTPARTPAHPPPHDTTDTDGGFTIRGTRFIPVRSHPVEALPTTPPPHTPSRKQTEYIGPDAPNISRRLFLTALIPVSSYACGMIPGAPFPFPQFRGFINWIFGGTSLTQNVANEQTPPSELRINLNEPIGIYKDEYLLTEAEEIWLLDMQLELDSEVRASIANRWLMNENGKRVFLFEREAYKAARLAQIKYGNFTTGSSANVPYFAHAMAVKLYETGVSVSTEAGNADVNHDYTRDMQDAWPQINGNRIETHYKENFQKAVLFWMQQPRATNPVWKFIAAREARLDAERRPLLDDGRPVTALSDTELTSRNWSPSEIHRMALNVPISSRADDYSWWGGAAGLSQLMPTKLMEMIEFYNSLTPPQVFDPWNPYHAMDGMGNELRRYPNSTEAHNRYYGGVPESIVAVQNSWMTERRLRLAQAIYKSFEQNVHIP